ncbi:MAG TPA: peptidylprolyl isomerase [bacterium]|nr:peptidylprolyl isomerase [bacterium]
MTKKFVAGLLAGAILFVGVALVIFNYGLKHYNWTSPTVQAIVKVLPFSAMEVNRYSYSYYDYLTDWNTLQKLMAESGQIEGMDELSLKQEILRSALQSSLVEVLADRYDLSVTQEDYDAAWKMVLGKGEEESVTEEELADTVSSIYEMYGFDKDTYERRVLRVYVLSHKLGDMLAKKAMDEVATKLQAGETFASLAAAYSDDGTAETGGDLGWFVSDDMIPEFVEKLNSMEKGQTSEVFQTRYGYHIVYLEDLRQTEDGKTEYKASHIIKLIDGVDSMFSAEVTKVIDAEKSQADIEIYINGVDAESLLY